ncbi:hypothetical protein DEJ15_11390 [Curtobacterium sp. MCJR17_043]|nr:hypothetical protein [Curtobacterium sp. MCJR17_043]WIB35061.1 hypothetical protein DEJ15_11390 [Curtobacterium sp. MCJR17_043]
MSQAATTYTNDQARYGTPTSRNRRGQNCASGRGRRDQLYTRTNAVSEKKTSRVKCSRPSTA